MTTLYAICVNKKQIEIKRFPLTDSLAQSALWLFTHQRATFFDNWSGDVHEYTGRYSPDAHELLYVEQLDEIKQLKEAADKSAIDISEIPPETIRSENIKALMIEADGELLIQRFMKSQYLSKKRTIIPKLLDSKSLFDEVEQDGILLSDRLCAVVQGTRLLFHKESSVRGFINLTNIFREATGEEISTFFGHDLFADCDAETLATSTSSINRKRIFSIIERGQLEIDDIADRIRVAATDADFPVQWENEKIIIPKNKTDLSTLLSILDDRIARGPISGFMLYINSSRKLS